MRQQSMLTFAVRTSPHSFVYRPSPPAIAKHFHVPFLRLDAVQDVVTTLCDKREAELQVIFLSSYFNTCVQYVVWLFD